MLPPSPAFTAALAASPGKRSAFSSPMRRSLAANGGGVLASKRASTVQYSSGTKTAISRSRSTMRRTATVCTRPAESPRRTLSQSSGLTL